MTEQFSLFQTGAGVVLRQTGITRREVRERYGIKTRGEQYEIVVNGASQGLVQPANDGGWMASIGDLKITRDTLSAIRLFLNLHFSPHGVRP